MTKEKKLDLVYALESGYDSIEKEIADVGREEMLFIPPIRDAWSINDFLVHFLDADTSLAYRFRTAIAEPGAAVPLWDEEAWHGRLRYEGEDGRACLALAKGLRSFVAVGLRSVVDEDWAAFYVEHPAKGKLDLVALVEMYQQHVVFHQPLIRRNMRAWSDRKVG